MSFVVGVIGHVDHGKTALVRALTGQETDRLKEEQARGISIALGFAHLPVGGAAQKIDLIDMPGHERFVRTMISGATGIDAVLLVVAANEGIKPQTVEHVDIAGLLGLRRALVAVTKTDLASPEEAEIVAEDAAELLVRAGLAPLAPVLTSAVQNIGIEALRAALATMAATRAPRGDDGLAFLPIDRAFGIAGHGPVVTGTLRGAPVAAGEVLELWPAGRPVRVRAVQIRGAKAAMAAPGQRVALNLRDVEQAELARGMALAAQGALGLSDWLTLAIRAVPGAPALKNGKKLRALLGTDEIEARLRLLDRDVLEPGAHGLAQLHFARPVAVPVGEAAILRLASPSLTVAGGKILEADTRRQRRNDAALLARLQELRDFEPTPRLLGEITRAGAMGTSLGHLSRLSALAPARIAALLDAEPVRVTKTGLVVQTDVLEEWRRRIPILLARQPDGMAPARLLAALPRTRPAVLEEVVDSLVATGILVRRGADIALSRPDRERARAGSEADLAARIAATLREGGLTPPDPAAVMPDLAAKRAVDRLIREGLVVRAVERAKGKEILFHQDAIDAARDRLAPLLQRVPGLLVSEVGAALGISRKYSMPLLDHLDSIRFTRRIGDRRILGK